MDHESSHRRRSRAAQLRALALLLAPWLLPMVAPAAPVTREQLVAANYRQGMVAFQQRCSACHSLADGGKDLAGPNLFGMFARPAGARPGFRYSDAMRAAGFTWTAQRLIDWVAAPDDYLPGSTMQLPEAVPEPDRIALASFLMLETGAADWPRPQPPAAARAGAASGAPLAERFPSFWNHLMKNTTRYRLEREGEAAGTAPYRFDVYFRTDGSAAASDPAIKGFWHVDETDSFCYALYGLPVPPTQFIECFPVVAMSIPRFREELWTSTPVPGYRLTGGIVAGRPANADRREAAPSSAPATRRD